MTQLLQMDADAKECAFIRLRGATERLLMIFEHRSEKHYGIAMQAFERAMAEYRTYGEKTRESK